MPKRQRSVPERSARIEFWKLPNGYWHAEVEVKHPATFSAFRGSGDLFHDAGECIEWARQQIEWSVSSV